MVLKFRHLEAEGEDSRVYDLKATHRLKKRVFAPISLNLIQANGIATVVGRCVHSPYFFFMLTLSSGALQCTRKQMAKFKVDHYL
jgi:hypothetical protein